MNTLRGRPVCAKQVIPNDFVFFQQNQDEDLPIILQSIKERIEALIRITEGDIEGVNGQIDQSFFDTSRIPERVGMSLWKGWSDLIIWEKLKKKTNGKVIIN